MARKSVFGSGYVGVVSAACLAKDGHTVVAVDVDPGKVEAINKGASPIVENGLPELIAVADPERHPLADSVVVEHLQPEIRVGGHAGGNSCQWLNHL